MKRIFVLMSVVALTAGVLRAEEPAATQPAAWKKLLNARKTDAISAAAKATALEVDRDLEAARKLIAGDTSYRKMPGGWADGSFVVTTRAGRQLKAKFHVRIPKGYDPEKSYPLLIIQHGIGGNGKKIGMVFQQTLGDAADDYILLAPVLPGRHVMTMAPYQEQTVLGPLEWAKQNLNVNDDRVFMTGYSLGGALTWHMGVMFPHQFAGVMPLAGLPKWEGQPYTDLMYFENARYLPIHAIWGEDDNAEKPKLGVRTHCRRAAERLKELKNEKFRGTERPDAGHGDAWPTKQQLLDLLENHTRTVAPRELDWRFHLDNHSRAYWLKAIELARKPVQFNRKLNIKLPAGVKPTKKAAAEAITKYFRDALFTMQATVDKDTNTIRLTGKGIRKVRLELLDGMLDYSKPVTLRYWSRKWTGKIPASAECMLEHYARTRDQTRRVVNVVDLSIFGRREVKYEE